MILFSGIFLISSPANAARADFPQLDVNKNGIVSQDEWPGNMSYNEFFNRKQIFASVLRGLDTNNDNRISRGEWTKPGTKTVWLAVHF